MTQRAPTEPDLAPLRTILAEARTAITDVINNLDRVRAADGIDRATLLDRITGHLEGGNTLLSLGLNLAHSARVAARRQCATTAASAAPPTAADPAAINLIRGPWGRP